MNHDPSVFSDLLENLITENENIKNIFFATDLSLPPTFSYQVNFPRVEFVINGVYRNLVADQEQGSIDLNLTVGDTLFIPPNCWNKPNWDSDCSILSLLFGKRQLGFSLVSKRKGETQFYDVQKFSLPARTGHAIDGILSAFSSLATETVKKPMDHYLLLTLLSYCRSMIDSKPIELKSKNEVLYQNICIYIQENFHLSLNRKSISERFNVSPNHLSRIFRQRGYIRLGDYIVSMRLERAKFMLNKYNFRLPEVALRCGFRDVNYFCRVFKTRTGQTPSEYRALK